jgi:hypothetical protein
VLATRGGRRSEAAEADAVIAEAAAVGAEQAVRAVLAEQAVLAELADGGRAAG